MLVQDRTLYDRAYYRIKAVTVALFWFAVKKHLQLRGASIGKGTSIRTAAFTWPHQVKIGRDCLINKDVILQHKRAIDPGPNISIGDNCFIGVGARVMIDSSLFIGDDCLIAAGCTFSDVHHNYEEPLIPINTQQYRGTPIIIQDDVWLGLNVIVLKGVCIGHGSIIGAGSVVTKNVPPMQVWAGTPATFVKHRGEAK